MEDLTIKMIKELLNKGIEVELECVDKHGLKKEHYGYEILLRLDRFIVRKLNGEDIFFNNSLVGLSENHLKHFCIKRHVPTFDDLIDVAVKAVKDKVLHSMQIGENKRKGRYMNFSQNGNSANEAHYENDTSPNAVINFIKSLYTETFVIESEEDIKRIKKDASVVLSNEMEVIASSDAFKIYNGWSVRFGEIKQGTLMNFSFLKGATVTQKVSK